jgi:hypothetical protein
MKDWRGKTVGELLARCGADYEHAEFHDEPPGKLRAVSFLCGDEGELTLEIDALFSETREWDRDAVLRQIVRNVRTEPNPDGL